MGRQAEVEMKLEVAEAELAEVREQAAKEGEGARKAAEALAAVSG